MPPPLARWAIETFTDPGDFVLDVMCGSGTTLVEAALTGRYGRGVDIDPLSRLIALAKAVPIDTEAIAALATEVQASAAAHLAAAEGRAVVMADLVHAIRREYQKLGKQMSPAGAEAALGPKGST